MLQYSKGYCLQWKAFDLLNKTRYILWVVALLESCDITKHGRLLGHHLGFRIKKSGSNSKKIGIVLCCTIGRIWSFLK